MSRVWDESSHVESSSGLGSVVHCFFLHAGTQKAKAGCGVCLPVACLLTLPALILPALDRIQPIPGPLLPANRHLADVPPIRSAVPWGN